MRVIEVFADVTCPFAHVELRRFLAHRRQLGAAEPVLHVRAWPLEVIDGAPPDAPKYAAEVRALLAGPAADLFDGFTERAVPGSTLPALASAAAAYAVGPDMGERFSLAVRDALWERGLDVGDPEVLGRLRDDLGVPEPTPADEQSVHDDLAEGRRRGVKGSPHWFCGDVDVFSPSLDVSHVDGDYVVDADDDGQRDLYDAAFG